MKSYKDILIEQIKKINPKILYHLSSENLDGKVLTPRIPNGWATKHKNPDTKELLEDNTISRVCFSESIDGALLGIAKNIEGLTFYVHEPRNYSGLKLMSNSEIIQKELIYDSLYTKEVWVLNPVKLKFLYKIRVGRAIDKYESIIFKTSSRVLKMYYWNWDRINKD